ncbi:DUF3592 domain-containing protein [Kribbella sp.]|uniref:DUF3592 domain-containing protein n=1 Tax=Kribbella sp. TaxID=1871183 RepID=UPI002D68F7AB|nr:DUF3592 domain-containing protein [Kribbella sp.]HZX08829.1 DUF3592 domain-containing protein [Kribbella sp.]
MSDDDLHGRQQALLLLYFVTVSAGLYFLGWLTRPSFLYDNPLVCGVIAGGTCYPARWLVERFSWWKRLEAPTRRTQARRDRALSRALATARAARHGGRRRIGWREVLIRAGRVLVGVPMALGSLAILPLGISADRDNQHLIAEAPVRQAVVVSVEEDKWSRSGEVTVKVAHPSDGAAVEVDGGDQLNPEPTVGDRIDVVVDPADPSNVVSAAVDWSTPWWAWPFMIFLSLVLLAIGLAIAFG